MDGKDDHRVARARVDNADADCARCTDTNIAEVNVAAPIVANAEDSAGNSADTKRDCERLVAKVHADGEGVEVVTHIWWGRLQPEMNCVAGVEREFRWRCYGKECAACCNALNRCCSRANKSKGECKLFGCAAACFGKINC